MSQLVGTPLEEVHPLMRDLDEYLDREVRSILRTAGLGASRAQEVNQLLALFSKYLGMTMWYLAENGVNRQVILEKTLAHVRDQYDEMFIRMRAEQAAPKMRNLGLPV